MKIAFFGTAQFSGNILLWLIDNNDIEVCFVVSQEDKPVWRKKILEPTAVKKLAMENNIDVYQPSSLKNNTEIPELWKELDFFVVVAYWKIVPQSFLDAPKHGCINLHGSILPQYRGASPVQEAIKNGDTITWLTTMYMSAWMDEWDMLYVEKINIDKDDTQVDIFSKFEKVWAELIIKTLRAILDDTIKRTVQDEEEATYCHKIQKSDGQVYFTQQQAQDIYNTYRAYTPWPGIWSYFHDKKIGFVSCTLWEESWDGEIWECIKLWKRVWIICQDRYILFIKDIKLEWKGTMNILDFINGNPDFIWYRFLDV